MFTRSIKIKLGAILTVMFALNLLTLLFILLLLQEQKDYSKSIDEASKMSMLSQIIPKDAFLLANDYKEVKKTLSLNSKKYDEIIIDLISGNQDKNIKKPSNNVKNEIEKTNELWLKIKKNVDTLLITNKYDDKFINSVEFIKDNNLSLLSQAENTVSKITEESQLMINKTLNFLYLFLILSIITFIFALITVINIVKPIIELTKATKTITRFNLRSNVNINSNDEIGELAKNFNHMLSNLEDNINKDNQEINY
ncbi:MAG: HAMP domain-containing protein [Candidatus Sericytochromatia bacterium]